jgi:hypothetical protein
MTHHRWIVPAILVVVLIVAVILIGSHQTVMRGGLGV